jgi:inhibitor of KinA sporulation pathway (predicted exonuclease)
MNFNPICVYDYETAGRDPDNCQIIEIAATMVHSRKLEIVDKFRMKIRPDWDAEGCEEDTIKWHAEEVRKITVDKFKAELNESPSIDVVWPTFVSWVDKYNYGKPGKSGFKAPVSCGYNIEGFDNPITSRYCHKYGPTEKDRFIEGKMKPRLFNQVHSFDVMKHMWFWNENIETGKKKELQNLQLGTLAAYMGVPESLLSQTHAADIDVHITAQMAIKLFKMERFMTAKKPGSDKRRLEMKNCFVDNFPMP